MKKNEEGSFVEMDLDKLVADMEAERKTFRGKLKNIYYFFKRIFNWIVSVPSEIKYFWQRGTRGWSDRDVWELHSYLSKIISESVNKLRQCGNSYYPLQEGSNMLMEDYKSKPIVMPSDSMPPEEVAYQQKGIDEWDKVLSAIVKAYSLLHSVTASDVELGIGWDEAMKEDFKKRYNTTFLTNYELKEIENGTDLFKKYFLHLWD